MYRSILTEAFQQHVTPLAADVAAMGGTLADELDPSPFHHRHLHLHPPRLHLHCHVPPPPRTADIKAQLLDIDQRLKADNAIAIEVLQNTAGLTAQAVKDIAAKPAPAGLAGDAPPITTWADMLNIPPPPPPPSQPS
eukprot:jgi/Mesvir1/14380/Mv09777-RA.1